MQYSFPTALCLLLLPVQGMAGESSKEPLPSPPPPASPDHFQISAGWMWRQAGDVRFTSGSQSGSLGLLSRFGSSRRSDPPIGEAGSYADRRYADGYVGVDGGTVNDGATSLWGYDNASQVEGDTIRYHAGGSRRAVSSGRVAGPEEDWEGDDGGNAPVVQLGWWREVAPHVSLGAQLQWSFLQLAGEHRNSNFTAWQQQDSFSRSFTDTYNLQGIKVPQAPYAGAGLGFGPLLDNVPAGRDFRESGDGRDRADYFNDIRQSLDLNVNTLSLGPTVALRSAAWVLQANAGFALNIVDWDAYQQETLYLSRNGGPAKTVREWRSHKSGTDFLPGVYLQSAATVQLTPRLAFTAFGRYEWSQKLEGTVGPSSFSIDLTGWSAGLMLGLNF